MPLFLCILAVAVLALAFVVRRPAQTSLDESSFVLVALAAITLGYRPRPVLVWPFVAGAALLCLLTFPAAEMVTTIRTSAASGEPRWQLHAHLMTYRQPVIVVIRDNSQALLSIEEMLLKGFSNQPTWYIGKGQDLLNRRSEWLSFRTANSAPGPGIDAPYPDTAVIAVFVRSSPSVIEEYPSLGEAVSRRRCQEWGFGAGNVVLICEPRS